MCNLYENVKAYLEEINEKIKNITEKLETETDPSKINMYNRELEYEKDRLEFYLFIKKKFNVK